MVTVNNKGIPYEPGMTVHTLLNRRGFLSFGTLAVYINGTHIRSSKEYQDVQVSDDDRIQVIDFLGGG